MDSERMRTLVCSSIVVLVAGCGGAGPEPFTARADHKEEPAAATSADPPTPDLWTRKSGSDWPSFLGPTGDSVSSEKGILAPWPREGPKIVWEKKIGQGYAMPAVSRGRLFVFDR